MAQNTIKLLNNQSHLELDQRKPIKQYLRSLPLILKQAEKYDLENDVENAYVMFSRFLIILIEIIPKHKEYHASYMDCYKRPAERAIKRLQELKQELLGVDMKRNSSFMTFDCNSTLSSEQNLRPVVQQLQTLRMIELPQNTVQRFLERASKNTRNNLETCALLCGKITRDSLSITHLILPKQEATSDTCQTLSETTLFTTQQSLDIYTFGWIHTHPSQSCFLSSIDLHTHYSYQKLIPEAIAIVCSPSIPEVGVFRLTEIGMEIVGGCTKRGFHQHENNLAIYERVEVRYSVDEINVVDLRI